MRNDEVGHREDGSCECIERELLRHVGVFLAEYSSQDRAAEQASPDDGTKTKNGDRREASVQETVRFFAGFFALRCGRKQGRCDGP